MGKAIEINSGNFTQVLQNNGKALLDFWAEWCGPCKQLSPLIDQLAEEHGDKVLVGKVNVDKNPELASQFQVSAIPTLIIFEGGTVKDQIVGLTSKKDLESRLEL